MADMVTPGTTDSAAPRLPQKKAFYRSLWVQVLIAVSLAIVVGYLWPETAVRLKPLGDAFIQLISMIISLVIFCTVVTGIAGMGNLKKVGRVGGKALLYFEVVTTIALLFALLVGNLVDTGSGLNADPATLDSSAVEAYTGRAESQTIQDFSTSFRKPSWMPLPRATSCRSCSSPSSSALRSRAPASAANRWWP